MNKSSLRNAALEINKNEFQKAGYYLIDQLADFYNNIGDYPVTPGETPNQVRDILGNASLPENSSPPFAILKRAAELLTKHSLFNGHPKFFGYITSSPAPIGALADLLAAGINPNVGANILSPMATAIEKQTVRWLCEFIGVPNSCGGILVSGGNMANLTAFLAARNAMAPKNLKEEGLMNVTSEMLFYCSKATHTWIEKAASLFGHGTKAIRWVPVDENNKMNTAALQLQIKNDIAGGKHPFLVVANAGDVSTGVVDNLSEIASICKHHNLWFHIDGAYGIPAAAVPEFNFMFEGIKEADSIALDPHKWLYSPLEAGCTLVKDPQHLHDAYSSHPVYYNFDGNADEPTTNYYEYGFQNSRGFRALKVWAALQQVGRKGYLEMINTDIELSKLLFNEVQKHDELEAITQNLSITTFRYVPLLKDGEKGASEEYVNSVNEKLLNRLQQGGKVFLSNAVVSGKYCLRACIVNFRTTKGDIVEVVDIVIKEGKAIHEEMTI
jgi:glutamate/tyrosine decarboxylase-like PLP-dependent enzyme